jgi:hypothetical protein
MNWFRSYLTGRQSVVGVYGFLSSPSGVVSAVPQESVLEPLLFCIPINDTRTVTKRPRYLLFADVNNTCHAVKTPNDCTLLQSAIGSTRVC